VYLYDDEDVLIDKLGLGTADDAETSTVDNPATDGSVERKATATSTAESMSVGGADEEGGNGEDTNNNLNDFIIRETSDPQNTIMTETPVDPTSTPTPTATPTPTPSA